MSFVRSVLSNFALLSTLAAVGCSADVDAADTESDEAAITTPCALGTTCPVSLQLLTAHSFLTSRPPSAWRSDLAVESPEAGWDATPRKISQTTSRPMTFTGGTALLAGNAAGDAAVAIDNFMLFEVLDLQGHRIGVAALNAGARVKLDGNPIPSLAPIPTLTGPTEGWRYAGGTVDIASILPTDRAFRLRVSALDYGGVALTSDVFLRVHAGAPPPPPAAADPWDPARCTAPPIGYNQAIARFAPATTHVDLGPIEVHVQKRTCRNDTGCTAWAQVDKVPYGYEFSSPNVNSNTIPRFFDLPNAGDASMASFDIRNDMPSTVASPKLRLHLSYLKGSEGVDVELPYTGINTGINGANYTTTSPHYAPSWVGPCTSLRCPGTNRVPDRQLAAIVREARVASSCLRIVAWTTSQDQHTPLWEEHNILFTAQY